MAGGSIEDLTQDQLLFAALSAPQDRLPPKIRGAGGPKPAGRAKRSFTASEFRKVRKAMGPPMNDDEKKAWLDEKVKEAEKYKWLADLSEL